MLTTKETVSSSPDTLYSLQYLRGIAASLIVLFHIFPDVNRYFILYSENASEVFGGGYAILAIGVDVFFVISGVVMVLATGRRIPPTAMSFYQHRILRIVPLYWAVTVSYAILILLLPTYFSEAKVEISHLIKSLFFIPAIAPNGEPFPLIFQGWTLSYEMLFYLFFGLSLLAGSQQRALLLCVTMVILWHLLIYTPLGENVLISRSADNILLEFLYGMLLGWLWQRGVLTTKYAKHALVCLVIAWVFAVAASLQGLTEPRFIVWGLPAAFLVAVLMIFENKLRQRPSQLFLFLGDVSYSLYLTHSIAISAILFGLRKTGFLFATPLWVLVSLMFVVAVLSSAVVHLLIEKPLTRVLRRRWVQKQKIRL